MMRALLLAALLLLLLAAGAFAQAPGVLDQLIQSFAAAANNQWTTPLRQYGLSLWWYLFALQLAWGLLAYGLAGPYARAQMVPRLLTQLILACAAYMLINQLPIWVGGLVFDSFAAIGENLAGDFMSPSLVVGYGAEFSASLLGGLSNVGLLDMLPVAFYVVLLAIAVLAGFVILAGQLVVVYLKIYFLLALGGFVAAFGANRWTARIAENYLAETIRVGFKLLLLTLIVSLGGPLVFDWGLMIQDGANWAPDIKPILSVCGAAMIFVGICLYIPNYLANRLTEGLDFGWTAAMRG